MCRSIQTLRRVEPAPTQAEIQAAAKSPAAAAAIGKTSLARLFMARNPQNSYFMPIPAITEFRPLPALSVPAAFKPVAASV